MLQHNYIGTEHILLGVIHEGEGVAARALAILGVSLEAARARVEEIIGHGGKMPSGHIPFTPRAKKVLELSLREALQLGHNYIGSEHILLGLVREGEGVGSQVLGEFGLDLERVRQAVIDLLSGQPPEELTESARAHVRVISGARRSGSAVHCALCDRDLWEVDRIVRAETGVICDICVEGARLALEGSKDRSVPMPPRVFVAELGGIGAVEAIVLAFRRAFGDPDLPTSDEQVIEDQEVARNAMVEAAARAGGVTVTGVDVSRIRFLGTDRAEVRFTTTFDRAPGAVSHDGVAVHYDERWLVSRDTIARVIAPSGVQLPPTAREETE